MSSNLDREDRARQLIQDLLRAQASGKLGSTCQYQHHIHTPFELCEEIVRKVGRVFGGKYLVLFNLEFVFALRDILDYETGSVYYYTTDKNKARAAEKLFPGVIVIDKLDNHMKFDVVVGNPPYQRETSKAHKLWPIFLSSAMKMAKDHVLMVTPTLFLDGGGEKIRDVRAEAFPKLRSVSYIDESVFRVGESICWFHLDLKSTDSSLKITYKDGQEKTGLISDLSRTDVTTRSIIEKIENPRFNRISLVSDFSSTDGSAIPRIMIPAGIISETKDENFQYEFIHSSAQRFYSRSQFSYGGKPKVCLNYSSSYRKMFYTTGVMGKQVEGILVQGEDEGERVIDVLTSKLFLFYIENEKNGGFNTGIYKLPALDFSRSWTDRELYDHFGLTLEERLHIDPEYKD